MRKPSELPWVKADIAGLVLEASLPVVAGFTGAACGPMVRSSYWADQQAHRAGVTE